MATAACSSKLDSWLYTKNTKASLSTVETCFSKDLSSVAQGLRARNSPYPSYPCSPPSGRYFRHERHICTRRANAVESQVSPVLSLRRLIKHNVRHCARKHCAAQGDAWKNVLSLKANYKSFETGKPIWPNLFSRSRLAHLQNRLAQCNLHQSLCLRKESYGCGLCICAAHARWGSRTSFPYLLRVLYAFIYIVL